MTDRDRIHDHIGLARQACEEYVKEVVGLQHKHGVWEDCSEHNLVHAKYLDENGVVKEYCYP